MPDDAHGSDKNITNKSFEAAGEAVKQGSEESKKNTLDLLKKVTGEAPSKVVKDESGFERYD